MMHIDFNQILKKERKKERDKERKEERGEKEGRKKKRKENLSSRVGLSSSQSFAL